jgi:hypothetical protein
VIRVYIDRLLLGGIFMAFLIFDGIDSGYMRGKRGGANFEQEPYGFYLLLVFYALLLAFCVHGVYESRKRLRKKKYGDIHTNQ